jgi:hypothetical protein
MKSKILVYGLAALILAAIHHTEAQQQTKVPRIGYLSNARFSDIPHRVEAFRQGLRSWVNGSSARDVWARRVRVGHPNHRL